MSATAPTDAPPPWAVALIEGVRALRGEVAAQGGQLDALREQIAALREQVTAQGGQLDALREATTRETTRLRVDLMGKLETTSGRLDDIEQGMRTIHNSVVLSIAKGDGFDERGRALEARMGNQDSVIAALAKQVNSLSERLMVLSSRVTAADPRNAPDWPPPPVGPSPGGP